VTSVGNDTTDIHETAAGDSSPSSDAPPCQLSGTWRPPSFFITAAESATAQSVEALHALLGEVTPDGLLASSAEEAELTMSAGDAPVPALRFDPVDAVDLLSDLHDRSHARLDRSLRFWSLAARYLVSLIEREQFAPDISVTAENTFEGRWRLFVASDVESAWLERLADAMPSGAGLSGNETIPGSEALDTFLTTCGEAIIRRSLDADEFFHDFRERVADEVHWDQRWLASLLGIRLPVELDLEPGELDAIVTEVRQWLTGLETQRAGNMPKLSIRLHEPKPVAEGTSETPASGGWKLELGAIEPLTGSMSDWHSLWNEEGGERSIMRRHLVDRRDHIRRQLRRAANAFDPLERVLDGKQPGDMVLSASDALRFIREAAPLMAKQNIVVELPGWALENEHRIGLALQVNPRGRGPMTKGSDPSLGHFGLSTVVDFNWRIALGDRQLSLDEFSSLVQRNEPLVNVGDEWFEMDQEAARQALKFLQQQPQGSISLLEAMRIAGGAEELDTGLPITGMTGSGWVEQFLDGLPDARVDMVDQPDNFVGELRPYQQRGLSWLAFLQNLGIGGCLADDMGLGKTIQLIALLLHERKLDPEIGPTLLFVPMSVVGNWYREIKRFGPALKPMIHHGPERLTGEFFIDEANRRDIVITTYGLAHRDLDVLAEVPWNRIALDEAQKIKNPSAAQTVAVRKLAAPHKLALTGTPLENHLSELWSIMETLNPGLLGSAANFRKRFAVPIEKMGDRQRAGDLRRLIRPFLLRRTKTDPSVESDLPDKMEMRVYCNLTAEQAALYQKSVDGMLTEIDTATGIRRRGLILTTLTRLKQICNHPVHFAADDKGLDGRSGKCERLVEMLEEVIEESDAALIFTQYREMGELLVKLLKSRLDVDVPFMHGGTTAKKRDEFVDRFQSGDKNMPLFLLSLRAGGFGLNLTRANHVFHFDRWWNPAVEEQATDRAHRIGQTRRVQVHKFVCIGTIEDRIDQLLMEKSALSDQIVGSGDEWLTGLSTTELREYLTLKDDQDA